MKHAKYTPGPWAVNDMAVNYVIHSANRLQARTDEHSEVDLANARLIAAAPDLLNALISAIEVIKFSGLNVPDTYLVAVAKATGGAK